MGYPECNAMGSESGQFTLSRLHREMRESNLTCLIDGDRVWSRQDPRHGR